MTSIEKFSIAAQKDLGMTEVQAMAFAFIVGAEKAKEAGNAKAYNHFEMRLAEMGVK